MDTQSLAVHAHPVRGRIDQPIRISVEGARPHSEVILIAKVQDGAQTEWTSRSVFRANDDGHVDVTTAVPLEGSSYSGADAHGPLWAVSGDGKALFARKRPTSLVYRLTATVDQETSETLSVVRHFGDDIHEEVELDEDVLGAVYRPTNTHEDPLPGVLILTGSDGGYYGHAASLLASEGYVVMALAYFGMEDLPTSLVEIDMEYIDRAIDRLRERSDVDSQKVAVVGISRGAELALEAASSHLGVSAVIATSPSALRQSGIASNYSDFSRPAWMRGGEPLGYNPGKFRFVDGLTMAVNMVRRRPMRQVAGFRRDLQNEAAVSRAAISVEHLKGPLMLVSGGQDQLWPSTEFSDVITRRLQAHNWPGQLDDVRYEEAGHFVAFPYSVPNLPPSVGMSPSSSFSIDFGGNASANVAATRDAWIRQLNFLDCWKKDRSLSSQVNTTTEGMQR